jgi:hypothetical protein
MWVSSPSVSSVFSVVGSYFAVVSGMAPLGVDLVRLRQRREVTDGPGDDVAVAVKIPFALLRRPRTRAISGATEGFSANTTMLPGSAI